MKEACGSWGNQSGCILEQYCGIKSNFKGKVFNFMCPSGKEKEGKAEASSIVPQSISTEK